mgnify:CR=1 FL=1
MAVVTKLPLVIDPVIDVGTGINNTALTTNDGFDRGLLLHYNTGNSTATDNHAFLGRDATSGELVFKYNIYPGGVESFPSTFTNTGTFGTAHFGTLRLSNGAASINTLSGDLQTLGGIGINKASYFADKVTFASTLANSTQTANHAIVVTTGGIGVAGKINTTDLAVTNTITGSISGNAATATKLATARTIAGQSFDGTANITIAASNLSDVSITTPTNNQLLVYNVLL